MVARKTSNLEAVGSSPTRGACYSKISFCVLLYLGIFLFFLCFQIRIREIDTVHCYKKNKLLLSPIGYGL